MLGGYFNSADRENSPWRRLGEWLRRAAALAVVLAGVGPTLAASAAESSPNLLLICVDDLRPELRCYGADYIHSPNIDRLAASGRAFSRHYVQAPTCGASRYALLTGRYARDGAGRGNGALVARAKRGDPPSPTFPEWFRRHGYTTVSLGKVSHHPGGLYGRHWNDPQSVEIPGAWDRQLMPTGPWRHPEGAMHGLAHGEIRTEAGKMDVFQSVAGADTIYPDGLVVEEALQQMELLSRCGIAVSAQPLA